MQRQEEKQQAQVQVEVKGWLRTLLPMLKMLMTAQQRQAAAAATKKQASGRPGSEPRGAARAKCSSRRRFPSQQWPGTRPPPLQTRRQRWHRSHRWLETHSLKPLPAHLAVLRMRLAPLGHMDCMENLYFEIAYITNSIHSNTLPTYQPSNPNEHSNTLHNILLIQYTLLQLRRFI